MVAAVRAGIGDTRKGRSKFEQDRAPEMGRWTEACFPDGYATTEAELRELIEEAAEAARDDYGVEAALEWADGYTFPPDYMESDVRCLRAAQLDFKTMVGRRLKQLAPGRLNAERVARLRADNPEKALMSDLVVGMKVHLLDGFTPNGMMERSKRRPIYESVAPAVNKMFGGLLEQRLAFLLPLKMAQECVQTLHLSKAHWTVKKEKPSGRPLGDLSNVDGTPLNTDQTAEAAVLYYGEIRHPTIENIAVMVYDFWAAAKLRDPSLRWEDVRIWKMDLKGAYTLLSFRPEDVGLFAMLLTEDIVYFQLAGIFGWSGTPAAFQVVTRAITWELKHSLRSSTVMYVDDIIGVCFADDLESDLAITRGICTDLLGSGAVADDKTEHGVRLDVIGYTLDLTQERVLIARKNFLTALHGFISTDVTQHLNLKAVQRLASWGTSYGKICRVMRPFCGALNRMTWGRTDSFALPHLSVEAVVAIQCWRAMLCLVRFRETEFTRSIESFAPATPILVAEFDSSLSGAGLIWAVRTNGTEVVRGVSAVDLSFLGFGVDSSYQNLSEYIGAFLAVIGQVMLGFSGTGIALRGDSVTALTWAMTERPRGVRVTNASMIWTLLSIATDIDVKEVTHIAGEDNGKCDRLSRRGTDTTISVAEEAEDMGIRGAEVIDLDSDEVVREIIGLCDPRTELSSEADFLLFWLRARGVIGAFVQKYVRTQP
jgi:hypothetical protein